MEIICCDYQRSILFFRKDGQLYKARYLAPMHTHPTPAMYLFNTNQMMPLSHQEQPILVKRENQQIVFQENVTSPICGRVVAIHVQAAQSVLANEPLVTIESMKMENEIVAPCDLFVKNISIACGDLVEQNRVLITVQQKKEKG